MPRGDEDRLEMTEDEAAFMFPDGLPAETGDEMGADEEGARQAAPSEHEADEAAATAKAEAEEQPAKADDGRDPETGRFKAKEADAKAEDGEREKGSRTVPHGAFHEERENRKAAEARAQRLEERLDAMLRAMQPKEKEPEKPVAPNPDEDPLGYVRHVGEQNQQTVQRIESWEQQQAEARDRQAVQSHFLSEAQRFGQATPDFAPAYEHFHKAMVNVAKMAGSQNPEADATQWQLNMVRQAAQSGQNSAEMFYNLAKQYGYQGAAPTPEPQQQAAPQGQDEAAKLGKLADAQQRHRSLSGGGQAAPGEMTAADIDRMSDEEFAAFMDNPANYRGFNRALMESH